MLPKVAQLIRGRGGIQRQSSSRAYVLNLCTYNLLLGSWFSAHMPSTSGEEQNVLSILMSAASISALWIQIFLRGAWES